METATVKTPIATEVQLWRVVTDPDQEGMFIGFGQNRIGRIIVFRSENRELLENELVVMQYWNADDGDDRFLAAWKRAVKVCPRLFHCDAPSIDEATGKEQLRPNWEAVEGFLRSKPEPWLRKFIMGACSFYNDEWMKEWAKKLRLPRTPIGDLAIRLDMEHREILATLLSSYRGW